MERRLNKKYIGKNRKVIIILLAFLLVFFVGCKHEHEYELGRCECGEYEKYTVIFRDYDGSLIEEQFVTYGKDATSPLEPTREGYIFTGWSEEFEDVKYDLEVVAMYEATECFVTFKTDEGELYSTETVSYNAKVTPPNVSLKGGKVVIGWFIGEEQFDFNTPITENITLSYKWGYLSSNLVTNIPDALDAMAGDAAILEGKVVSIYEEWDSEYNNMSFIIADEQNNQILVYRAVNKVAMNDIVKIEGNIVYYSGSAQVAQGAIVTILETGEYIDPSTDEEALAVLKFDDLTNRVSFSINEQVWESNGITFTNELGESDSLLGDYYNPVRCYTGTNITIEYSNELTKVVIVTAGSKNFSNELSIAGASVTVNGLIVTIVFNNPVKSFEILELPFQVRIASISVYSNEN